MPQRGLQLSAHAAMPLSKVTATATGLPPEHEVQLRWNTPDGQLLASGTGPAFTTEITIPDVPGGCYVVVAQATAEHGEHSRTQDVIEVLGAGGTPPPPPPVAPPPPPPVAPPPPPDRARRHQP